MVQSWRGGGPAGSEMGVLGPAAAQIPLLRLQSSLGDCSEPVPGLGDNISDGSPRHLLGTQVLPNRGKCAPRQERPLQHSGTRATPLGTCSWALGPSFPVPSFSGGGEAELCLIMEATEIVQTDGKIQKTARKQEVT